MESTSQLKNITLDQSSSENIIDDEVIDESKTVVSDTQSEKDVKKKSSSQIIEDESEDLSQFVGDVNFFFGLIHTLKHY